MAWNWELLTPLCYGAGGAIWYAAPRLRKCLRNRQKTGDSHWGCIADAVVAILCGSIAAQAFVPYIAELMHQDSPKFVAALSAGWGLAQRSIAPLITSILTNAISGAGKSLPPPGAPTDES